RLGGEDVDARATHPAVLERQRERVLAHDAAAGGVDDQHSGLDEPKLALADQAGRLGIARQVHADHVGLPRPHPPPHPPHGPPSATGRTPVSASAAGVTNVSWATPLMPNPAIRWATSSPIRPRPRIPATFW